MMSKAAEKSAARGLLKSLLNAARAEDLASQSAAICDRVAQLPVHREAAVVAGYLTCAKLNEVDTAPLISALLTQQKRLYVPVVADRDSNMHMLHLDSLACVHSVPPFGIQEPRATYDDGAPRAALLQAGNADLPQVVLMPGLGFDRLGGRLGRGGGYYDAFIARLMEHAALRGVPRPSLVGLCFREQLQERVPTDAHDQRVDWLVTPDEVIDCRAPALA